MPAAPLRSTVTAGIAVNLSTAAIHAAQLPTIISSAPQYLTPFRRRDVDPRLVRGRNLDTGTPQMDGTMRTSALVPNSATTGNSLPPPRTYLAMNARSGDDQDRVAGAHRNIAYHYSTEWETQLVQDLSAEEKIIKRLQASANAKRALLMTGCGDLSTSAPNQYLSVQQQANLNPYAQPFAPTSVPIVPHHRLLQGYAASLPAPLYGVQYGRPMGNNGT